MAVNDFEISSDNSSFKKLSDDIRKATEQWLFKQTNDEQRELIRQMVNTVIEKQKNQNEYLSFFEYDTCVYSTGNRGMCIDIIPLNEETFNFFARNIPNYTYNKGWDKEQNRVIGYM